MEALASPIWCANSNKERSGWGQAVQVFGSAKPSLCRVRGNGSTKTWHPSYSYSIEAKTSPFRTFFLLHFLCKKRIFFYFRQGSFWSTSFWASWNISPSNRELFPMLTLVFAQPASSWTSNVINLIALWQSAEWTQTWKLGMKSKYNFL